MLTERLGHAQEALERERYDDARRIATSLLRELSDVAAVHEVIGLAAYRSGRWKQAAQELELAQELHPTVELLPGPGRRLPGPAPLGRRRAGVGRGAGGLAGTGGPGRGPHRGRRRPGRPG